MRPTDLIPKPLVERLLEVTRAHPDWLTVRTDPDNPSMFSCLLKPGVVTSDDLLNLIIRSGRARAATLGMAKWLADGPKVFIPTPDQCRAMQHVSLNLSAADYQQAYPAMLVKLVGEEYGYFKAVLSYVTGVEGILVFHLFTDDSMEDITTIVNPLTNAFMEGDVTNFAPDCKPEEIGPAVLAYRTAINLNLALVNYGTRKSYLYPKELVADQRLAKEKSERGERARKRIALAVERVSFAQEIKLHHELTAHSTTGVSLSNMPCH